MDAYVTSNNIVNPGEGGSLISCSASVRPGVPRISPQ